MNSIHGKINLQKLKENKDMLRQRKTNRIGCWQNDPLGLRVSSNRKEVIKERTSVQQEGTRTNKQQKYGYIP